MKRFPPHLNGTNVHGVSVPHEGQPDEELSTSMVVVGVGVRPDTALFKRHAELDVKSGVSLDSLLRTSV